MPPPAPELRPRAAARAATGGGFEGVVHMRSIEVTPAALREALSTAPLPDSVFAVESEALLGLGADARVTETILYIKRNRLRAGGNPGGEPGPYVIMDVETGTVWTVTPAERRVTEWTLEDADRLADRMARQRAEADSAAGAGAAGGGEREAAPDQGAEGEDRYGGDDAPGRARGGDPPAVRARPLEVRRRLYGFPVEGWALRRGRELGRAWVTGEHPELRAVFRGLAESVQRLDLFAAARGQSVLARATRLGFPVRIQMWDPAAEGEEAAYRVEEVLAVRATPVPELLFWVPGDYRRTRLSDILDALPE